MQQAQHANAHAKRAADLLHAADKRVAALDRALRGLDHSRLKEAYASFFTPWEADFEAAVAANQQAARQATATNQQQLTLFTMR